VTRALLPLAAVLALLPAAPAAAAAQFANPIRTADGDRVGEGAEAADPHITTFRGRYHLVRSTRGGIVVHRARSLAALATAPGTRIWPPAGGPEPDDRSEDPWAPELHRIGRRWYLYTAPTDAAVSLEGHRMHVYESAGDDPRGPYRHRARLELGGWAIDATVAEVRGRRYLIWSGLVPGDTTQPIPQRMLIQRLATPWRVTGRRTVIAEPTLPWELAVNPVNEAPAVLERRGKVHVVFSASSCLSENYRLGRLTVRAGDDLLDPATWRAAKFRAPIFQTAGRVFGPGHNGFFRSPDGRETWNAYHATDVPGPGCFGGVRTTRAQRVTWTRSGDPVLGRPAPLSAVLRPPSGDRSLTVQAESARVAGVGSYRPGPEPTLVGGRGLALRPGTATLTFRVPRDGAFTAYLREDTAAGWTERRLGRVRVRASRLVLRVTVPAGAVRVLDQLRLE
jgi:GH43 family beta-xylosidase